MRHKKTEWGLKVKLFCNKHGITIKEIAEATGVKASVVYATSVNRTAGYEVIKTVDAYMEQYEAAQQANS